MKIYIVLSLALLAFIQMAFAAPAAEAVADPEADPTLLLGLLAGAAASRRGGYGGYVGYGGYGGGYGGYGGYRGGWGREGGWRG